MLIPLALVLAVETLDSGGVLIPEEACYDVESYALEIEVDPEKKRIDGKLEMTAVALSDLGRIALDLDDRLAVTEVSSKGKHLNAGRTGGRIFVDMPDVAEGERFSVLVKYGGEPREAPRPPWDGGFTWSKTKDGEPWIATSCQGEGADLWWPCKDHPSDKPDTFTLTAIVPKDLFCASNGTLAAEKVLPDGRRLYQWKLASPVSNYNIALNIAPYKVVESSFKSVDGTRCPVYFWVLPEHVAKAREILPEFLDHLAFFEEFLGPYPFRNEKYGVVETPHLGMEHQTIIAYGNRFRGGPDGYDWLHHHELSHEWFANLVTCPDWNDMWIHEGFGTYMQALYTERKKGPEGYRAFIEKHSGDLKNRRPVAPRESRSSKEIYFDSDGGADNDIYYKGACILHTLRWTVGNEAFFKGLRRVCYPDPALEKVPAPVHFATTEDVRRIFEEASGRDLSRFFDVYLRQPELPKLSVEREGGELRLAWTPVLDVPVPVRVGDDVRRVEMAEGKATVRVAERASVEVDPDGWLLRGD